MKKLLLGSGIITTALVLAANVYASSSFRCGVYIIAPGSNQYEVLKKCGEPSYRNGFEWVYESPTKLTRVLGFGGQGDLLYIKEIKD